MDEQSGELTKEEVIGAKTIGELGREKLVRGWRIDTASHRDRVNYRSRGEAYRKEQSVIEDDVSGRARVTRDEERVLRRRWTEMVIQIII